MKKFITASLFLSINLVVPLAIATDTNPLVKVINAVGVPADVVLEERYLDIYSQPCTEVNIKTLKSGYDEGSQQWQAASVYKPLSLPANCVNYAVHVKSMTVDASSYATVDAKEDDKHFSFSFNNQACWAKGSLINELTSVIELNVNGLVYTRPQDFYCTYGNQ